VAQIVLDGPSTLNALGVDTLTALESWLTSLDANQSIRAVILTGAGRAFCVGADLNRLGTDHERTMAAANSLIQAIRAMDVPLIAAVNGLAVGYGASLVATADLAIAAESMRMQAPFTALGLVPDGGLTHALPALAGRALAGGDRTRRSSTRRTGGDGRGFRGQRGTRCRTDGRRVGAGRCRGRTAQAGNRIDQARPQRSRR